jgi:uncharacterized protein RhaS with RHS repeats
MPSLDGGINTYAYVGGNPISMVDPTGEIGFPGAAAGFGIELGIQAIDNYRNGCSLFDPGNYNWGQVGIATAVGAIAPGWLSVSKTGATSGRAISNLSNQLGRARTPNRSAKIESRIDSHWSKIADPLLTQVGFQGAKFGADKAAGNGGSSDCTCKK